MNIGITVRWWHHLNPRARVFGFDMMEEAHAFTKSRIGGSADWYVPTTCALAATEGSAIQLSFDDPLFGENSVGAKDRKHQRTVQTGTLDVRLSHYHLKIIDLLKVDIEGYGAEALKGAVQTLRKTRYVMFETHSRTEVSQACRILHDAGFEVIGMRARTLVLERERADTTSIQSAVAEALPL
ncbi:FkbM family methyltransferase [Pararobbsia alpina]|uniref:FkbM family methyltransferase n=1 Tax=Pararobbsia alpina TaxID=621374 RepID=UPI0039A45A69